MGDWMAAIYDPIVAPLDPMGMRAWRQWAVGEANGRVLELGVGTGLNLKYYRKATAVVGIDPNGASLERAHARAHDHPGPLLFCRAGAERLPFGDDVFDSLVGSLVFCTIPDPDDALKEAWRVLQPGGRLRIVEHVRMANRVMAGLQDFVTPFWSSIAGGCHLNRDTRAAVEKAGFEIRACHRRLGGLLIGIDAIKPASGDA
jgi:ubiquinone/menaquinone biosynthesis C-methylase UbiE